jgi:hypothetical protein
MIGLLILAVGLILKVWNDRHAVGVGHKIKEKVKDVLLDHQCKIDGENVKCRREFAGLGSSFTVQEAVDALLKTMLKDIGVDDPSAYPPPPQPQQGPPMGIPPSGPFGPSNGPMMGGMMPPPQVGPPRSGVGQGQSSQSGGPAAGAGGMMGMSGMGGLMPADFAGGGGAGGASGQLGGMPPMGGQPQMLRQPPGADGKGPVPFQPVKTRGGGLEPAAFSGAGASYNPNPF